MGLFSFCQKFWNFRAKLWSDKFRQSWIGLRHYIPVYHNGRMDYRYVHLSRCCITGFRGHLLRCLQGNQLSIKIWLLMTARSWHTFHYSSEQIVVCSVALSILVERGCKVLILILKVTKKFKRVARMKLREIGKNFCPRRF